jgi:hypothetical protein
MIELSSEPVWGVLVEAPVEKVREFLTPLGDVFVVRTNHGWTAAFCMEPGNCSYQEVTAPLQFRGHAPIYHFDYSKYDITTSRWDGNEWNLLQDENGLFVSPAKFLDEVDIKDPYWGELPRTAPAHVAALKPREAIVVEGASVHDARKVVAGEGLRIEAGPRGAVVYQPDPDTRFAFWERAPGRVLEVTFYPESGQFWYCVMKGEECLGTFRPGETRTWDGTPFLASVDGETEPEAIIDRLGIERSFLARA